jgi:hypothetical protein
MSNDRRNVEESVTESLSSEDSVDRGARELIAMRFAETHEETPDDTESFVTNANPQRLVNSGIHDDLVFEVHDDDEEKVGVEGRDWMSNPFKRLDTGGFDFVVRVGRRKMEHMPGTWESFQAIREGKTNLGRLKVFEIHGGVRIFHNPGRVESRTIIVGEERWNM